jgi:hypothetical protein
MLIATSGLWLLAGCSSAPIKLGPVGPVQSSMDAPSGWLKVFTATKTVPEGDATYYYPHYGYRIYTESGNFFEFVPNHLGDMDQSPALVKIPAGKYVVAARSEPYNMVTVPIKIEAGKTTEVHLGAHWKVPSNVPTNEIVYFPDGRPVGWKSSTTKSSE